VVVVVLQRPFLAVLVLATDDNVSPVWQEAATIVLVNVFLFMFEISMLFCFLSVELKKKIRYLILVEDRLDKLPRVCVPELDEADGREGRQHGAMCGQLHREDRTLLRHRVREQFEGVSVLRDDLNGGCRFGLVGVGGSKLVEALGFKHRRLDLVVGLGLEAL